MKDLLFAGFESIAIGSGVLLIITTWGGCALWLTNFLDENVASALRPVAESFGMSTGNLFSSHDGACRKWWADLIWVIGVAFIVIGSLLLASRGMKTVTKFKHMAVRFRS